METRPGHWSQRGPQTASRSVYSTRGPDIARAITNCWISDVPSKIVGSTVRQHISVMFSSAGDSSCHPFRPLVRVTVR